MSTRTRSRSVVTSTPIDDPGPLLSVLRTPNTLDAPIDPGGLGPLAWTRGTDGFVAWGEAARLTVSGPDRFSKAAGWWRDLTSAVSIRDQVGLPGSGPVAFASFTFEDGPDPSVVVVPEVVIARRGGAAWITRFTTDPNLEPQLRVPRPPGSPSPAGQPAGSIGPGPVRYSDGAVSSSAYEQAVASAVERINGGTLQKVVLARDLLARTEQPIDARALLVSLSTMYPTCWTFSVDGLIGATPELLIRRTGDHIISRVLAGTTARSTDAAQDAEHAAWLLGSRKDRVEHDLAVRSVAEGLSPFCSDLVVPRTPELVRLANVQHLQTDISGKLANGESALDLVGALHPTAAVCGTPSGRARAAIAELEGMNRGRYAGPVGWIDARGDGAFGIALRCAQIDRNDRRSLRMFAGCGIVAGSTPKSELAESQAKLLAMREALEN